ncbi:MAG: MoxR-like ATPase [Myxococcota bacterium]|jgi:MoxR-like ATPase
MMEVLESLTRSLTHVVRGQGDAARLLLVGFLAGGHVLVEDVPGVGKTTLAKALARSLQLDFSRVQCTPDLLPTDILGANVLDPRDGSLSFHHGPVFTQILLVDETNRASPRTQSGLLEAMNERQVTVDGVSHPLPDPFFVVATQNPVDFHGTYPLPFAQLDRFLLRLSLGYPDEDQELEVLYARKDTDPLDAVRPVAGAQVIAELKASVRRVAVSQDVGRYLLRLVRATRGHRDLELGVSPRGALALFRASQALAMMNRREFVLPDDVQQLTEPVLAHRLLLTSAARYGGRTEAAILREILESVDVPA